MKHFPTLLLDYMNTASVCYKGIKIQKVRSSCKRVIPFIGNIFRLISVRNMDSVKALTKPPNVLVYCAEKKGWFKNIAVNLLRCLHADKYVVYDLTKSQVLSTPWKENAALLVVCCDEIDDSIADAFRSYFENSGKGMIFCTNFSVPKINLKCSSTSKEGVVNINYKSIEKALVYRCKFSYSVDNSNTLATVLDDEPVVIKTALNGGTLVVSAIHLALDPAVLYPAEAEKLSQSNEKRMSILRSLLGEELGMEVYSFTVPSPTSGYIIVENDVNVPESLKNIKEINLGKCNQPSSPAGDSVQTDIKVPLLVESQAPSSILFDKTSYFSRLKSNKFGHTVVFFPVVTSTMIPAEKLYDHEGIVVIASRQISGRGRGDNVWISPEGCAMFTLHFSLSLTTPLGQRMSIIQHMATLAVVHSIKKIPAYEKLDFRLKWPNDLYLGKSSKIGGVLVNTTILGNDVHAHVGIGVNVSNYRPTVCINSAIEAHNSETGDTLPLLKTEEVIASAVSELETLVDDFAKSGSAKFLSLYYRYWLHKDQRVTLLSLNKEAVVQGIDDYGFLGVQTDDGKLLSLQPDGNRFDIMKNLIIAKE